MAEASTRQTDLAELFKLAADGILDASLAKRAVVLLPDEKDGTLLPVVVRSRDDDKAIVISRTIVDQAVRQGFATVAPRVTFIAPLPSFTSSSATHTVHDPMGSTGQNGPS